MSQVKWNGERLAYLDFIRGFAVLGLLFMNIPHMGLFELGYVRFEPALVSDTVLDGIKAVLLDGRFRSLFCLLFGIGLYLQSLSYQKRDLDHASILKTRMLWLLLFGLIHCVFIWPGDILIMYALCGLFLISRLNWSSDRLLQRGKLFFVIGLVLMFLEAMLYWYTEDIITRDSATFSQAYDALLGPYRERLVIQAFVALVYILTFPILSLFYLGGVMLIGLGLFKSGKLSDGFTKQEVTGLAIVTALVSGVHLAMAIVSPALNHYLAMLFGSVSGLTMALLIWHWIVTSRLFTSTQAWSTALKRVGGMALSFYIFQSVIATLLLQVFYPEWILTFTQLDYFVMALVCIALQLVLGFVYKGIFKQGPLEYMWRKLVERKVNAIVRQNGASTAG